VLTALLYGANYSPTHDRSPAIVPVAEDDVRERLSRLPGWSIGRTQRISSGFYKSHALELVRHG
jgi:magnesium-protoporphyrin O-methyltransferase